MNIDVGFNWYHRMSIFKSGICRLIDQIPNGLSLNSAYNAIENRATIFLIYSNNLFHENCKK